ncbi:MAG: transporter substrate-binding domain-containing protein [Pseudomonadales bacterium]|nr:transporter substrate-binding domain-containing protein [Pseudomonadales bacterium]
MLQLRVILLWITGILFLLCRSVMASPDDNRGPKELLIGISFSIPPYVIQEKDNGLELEVLRQAFEVKGYTVLPSYLPLARTFMSFEDGSLDGVINVKEGMVNGHYSDIVITFQNYAISLSENNLKIDSLQDLGGKSVAAFQRAAFILGADFANVVLSNSDYLEVADQSLQVKQLFRDRVEVIVMEEKIFKASLIN